MGSCELKIVCPGPTPNEARILLDGHDITHGVQKLILRMAVGELNKARLILLIDKVEVDAQLVESLVLKGGNHGERLA